MNTFIMVMRDSRYFLVGPFTSQRAAADWGRRRDAVRDAASRARLRATLADLQAVTRRGARTAAAAQRAQLRSRVAGLLAKAAEASRNGRLTAHQVAMIEAQTHRLTARIGL